MRKSRVLVAQLGARKHYLEPILFHRFSILEILYTDFYAGRNWLTKLLDIPKIYKLLPKFLKKYLDRYAPQLINARITGFPIFGYQYVQALKKALPQHYSQIFIWAGQEFCQRIIKQGLGEANIIYGFNSACLELFQYAKKKGIYCLLDQTLADYSLLHQLLLEEEKIWTEWSLSPFSVTQSDLELMEREHREQDIADHIVCGSNFVKDSLIARGVNSQKITVVQLGRLKEDLKYPETSTIHTPQQQGDGLKILFVGSVNLRKGIPYLLQALRQIEGKIPFSCKIAGSLEIKDKRIAEYSDVCDFLGRIPRSQIKDLYIWADVLVLPSICEGSAMVTYEALSLGVPVITTYNSGSIVRDGIDGFIVPERSVEAIAEKLTLIYKMGNKFSQLGNKTEYLQCIFEESQNKLIEIATESYKRE